MIGENTHLPQTVERIEGILAYLYGDYDLEHPVPINLVIVNKVLDKIEIPEPYKRRDFNDLKTDIELCLTEWHGYSRNEIDLGIL